MTVYLGLEFESWEAVMKHLLMYNLWLPDPAMLSERLASKYIGLPKTKVLVAVISFPDAVANGDTSLSINTNQNGCQVKDLDKKPVV